jgi:hypothetical protein
LSNTSDFSAIGNLPCKGVHAIPLPAGAAFACRTMETVSLIGSLKRYDDIKPAIK